jgi:hypothetical protein
MYVIVFKDINETKNRHPYTSQVVIFTNDLEKLTLSWKYFDEVESIMSQKPYALTHFFPIWCTIKI